MTARGRWDVGPKPRVNELAVRQALLSGEYERERVQLVRDAAGEMTDREWQDLLKRQHVAPCDCCDTWFDRSVLRVVDYDKAAGNHERGRWLGFLCKRCDGAK